MQMVHPFDLPEILGQITALLGCRTLFCCTLVSKSWYRAFLPALWNDVRLDQINQLTLDSLARHSHLVQAISWRNSGSSLDLQTLSLDFPRLRSFSMNIDPEWNYDLLSAAVRLIQRQGHILQTISLSSDQTHLGVTSGRFLWDIAITGCQGYRQLRSLSLHRIGFIAENLDDASKELLKQLDSFSLSYTVLHRAGSYSLLPQWGLAASKIRHLSLTNCEHDFPSDHLETEYRLLLDCQEIRSLKWERYLRDNMVPIATDLQRGLWPFLEKLDFQGLEVGDEALAEIFWSLGRPLRDLNANHTGFGPLSYRALLNLFEDEEGSDIPRGQKHALALERLILQACPSVTGTHIQSLLCSLPKLEVFSATLLKEDDVLADPRPWVCKQIRKLELNFALLELDMAIAEGNQPEAIAIGAKSIRKLTCFWERLKDLTALEEYSSGNSRNITMDRNDLVVGENNRRYPFLLFQLEDDPIVANGNCTGGLGALLTWRKMRRFALWNWEQDISLSDARWMVDNWLMLEEVITYKWREEHAGVKELFEAHGVRF